METTRQKKVSRLVQKELSSVFQKEIPGLLGNVITSITIVRVSPDLANANIFISIFPAEDPKKALKVIKKNGSESRIPKNTWNYNFQFLPGNITFFGK